MRESSVQSGKTGWLAAILAVGAAAALVDAPATAQQAGAQNPQQYAQPVRRNWAVNHTLVTTQGDYRGRSGPVSGGVATPFQRIDPRLYDQSYSGVTQYPGPFTLEEQVIAQRAAAEGGDLARGAGASVYAKRGERDALGRRPANDPDGPSKYASGKFLQELTFGVHYHDAAVFGNREEDGIAVSLEAIFRTWQFLDDIGAPRPTIGAYLNTAGDTSYAYAGVTWSFEEVIWDDAFINLFLGLTIHDGGLTRFGGQSGKEFGSRIIFREAAEFGWRFNDRHGVSFLIDHISNANTSGNNEGLDSVALRYGYRF